TDPDINGRFMIESKQGGDDDLESEYHRVFFYLKSPEFPAAEIYITGNLRSSCNSDFRMHYNAKAGHYEAALFLKQGYYNYRYLMTDPYNPKGTLEYTEGNYSQTENQYTFIVYHYNHAVGYDRIIAFERDNSLP
ncbi:MAG: hypothetical protein JNM00_11135, partial [Flavobacteriales bacterium]|nr:hypothetical protein [Flavobacteriales bacterium]